MSSIYQNFGFMKAIYFGGEGLTRIQLFCPSGKTRPRAFGILADGRLGGGARREPHA
jgi:hypothetical protein